MANVSQVIRWNANFVRGLAQSVLDRAKVIRSSLTAYSAEGRERVTPIEPVKTRTAPKVSAKAKKTARTASSKRRSPRKNG